MEWFFPALCGLVTGILSSWGVGGGTLLLLCMTLFFGVEQRTAQAINLLYFLPTAGISLLAHRKNGYLDRTVLRAAVPLGTLCALAAAFLATTLDSSLLRKPFGLFLLYAGASILLEKPENKTKRCEVSSQRLRFHHFFSVICSSASFAAICSASFLLRPAPLPTAVPLSNTSKQKVLSWSGPLSPNSR